MTATNISQLSVSALKTNFFNERFLYNVNRDSFSKISAEVIFDTEYKKKLFDEDSLYIIVGTDSGLLPKYIQQRGIPLGTRYLFIEIEEILDQIHQHHLLESLEPEILCTTVNAWKEHALELKFKDYSFLRNVHSLKAICAQQVNLAEYAELNWQVAEELQSLDFQFISSIGAQPFICRQIQNISDNILPIKLLHNIYKDKTAIVLAGGPSLTKILPWVKVNREKLIIFSVSRISRQLIKASIEPDFVCSVDPQAINIDVSKEMFMFKNSVFIHSFHVDSALVNQWVGLKLYFGNRFPWKTSANPDNINSVGPTVSNSALAAASYCGCKQILLAGFDLCFTKDGITHAEGSDEALSGPKYDTSLLEVETYNGEKRTTTPEYHLALLNLGRQAAQIKSTHTIIINLALEAAKAENISHAPTEQIILDTPNNASTGISIPQLSTIELQAHHLSTEVELKKAIHHIKLIEKLATKALKINEKMYSLDGQIENYKDKRSLDNIEKQLQRKHRTYSALIKNFGVKNFIRITSPHGNEDSWSAEKAKEIGRIYYSSYQSGSQELLSLLESALLRTQVRLEELKDAPDFSLLINQWTKDKSYNRATLWGKLHIHSTLPDTVNLEFQALKKSFLDILNSTDSQFKKITEAQPSFDLLKTKAILLFKHNKIEGLRNLLDGLIHTKTVTKEPYELLLSAYIAELDNNIELALEHHNQIINLKDSPLLEESLLRVVSISIQKNDHANTLLALQCLSQISPIYLPFYAESSRITGDSIKAIDCYIDFINFFPEDIICKLKLTRLYIDLKVYEAAELMLEHILAEKPDMEIALQLKTEIENYRKI